MKTSPSILVQILTFNEAENLPSLLHRVFSIVPNADVLVLDDNSPDGTAAIARGMAAVNPRLEVIVRESQRGLGSAMCRGFQFAISHEYDWVVNIDGDLSHDPKDLPALIARATGGHDRPDLVIGSRYVNGGRIEGWSLRRRLMSRLVNQFATMVLRLPVRDCSGGFRCYRVSRLRELNFSAMRSKGYSIQEELLIKLRGLGALMVEVPIVFSDRARGESKLTSREVVSSIARLIQMAATCILIHVCC